MVRLRAIDVPKSHRISVDWMKIWKIWENHFTGVSLQKMSVLPANFNYNQNSIAIVRQNLAVRLFFIEKIFLIFTFCSKLGYWTRTLKNQFFQDKKSIKIRKFINEFNFGQLKIADKTLIKNWNKVTFNLDPRRYTNTPGALSSSSTLLKLLINQIPSNSKKQRWSLKCSKRVEALCKLTPTSDFKVAW